MKIESENITNRYNLSGKQHITVLDSNAAISIIRY